MTQVIFYRNWLIYYDPPPIPNRNMDYQFYHQDFDGAPDSGDDRYGAAESIEEAKQAIDEWYSDDAESQTTQKTSNMHLGHLSPTEWRAYEAGMAQARAEDWAHRERIDKECGRKVLAENSRENAAAYQETADRLWAELAKMKGFER